MNYTSTARLALDDTDAPESLISIVGSDAIDDIANEVDGRDSQKPSAVRSTKEGGWSTKREIFRIDERQMAD